MTLCKLSPKPTDINNRHHKLLVLNKLQILQAAPTTPGTTYNYRTPCKTRLSKFFLSMRVMPLEEFWKLLSKYKFSYNCVKEVAYLWKQAPKIYVTF